ncbi:ABC transporter permease [Gallaecimonas kandeliae]|uniref:ABC transporter permease n=1 Tax=Gallaecimonas kandeliae TaxID=3029055 RepID=UPI002649B7E3|nr:FtsX-like permease family protein [Gallaecimonas kandeliae]WKE64777.1 ABC transporter permease [Gallaecimonas kandeliae]
MLWLHFAFLNVWRNARRSVFTMLVTAIATLAIMTSAGFALFTYHSLAEKAARDEGNLTISDPRFFSDEEEVPMAFGLKDVESIRGQLLADDDVKAVLPRLNFTGLVSNGEKTAIFIGLGVEPQEFHVKGPFLDMLQGQPLSSFEETRPQVVLAQGLAKSLKVKVGDFVTLLATTTSGALNAFDFEVKGIYSTGVPDLDKRQLYVDIPSAKSLLDTDKVSSLAVYLFDIDKTADKLSQYAKRFPAQLVTPWWQRAFYYQSVRDLYNRIFGLLGAVMVLLVFFSISNTMGMTVTERTREIGTVAAMGGYRWETIRNFTLESCIIGILGALAGIALSFLLTWALLQLHIQMPPPPGSSKGYPLTIEFSWPLAALTSLILTLICVLAAVKAAYKGSSKNITEALSHV